MRDSGGFTLMELIMVLALIGILAAVVIPSSHMLEKQRLQVSARRLQMDIRYAQRRAMSEGIRYMVKFPDPDKKMYQIARSITDIEKKSYVEQGVQIADVGFGHDGYNIIYTSKGTVSQGGTVTLQTERYEVEITVTVATGRAEIKEMKKR